MIVIGYKSLSSLSCQPKYLAVGDVGMMLRASQNVLLPANSFKVVHTSASLQIPIGYTGIVTSIGKLARDFGITTLFDDYINSNCTDELLVALKNNTDKDYQVHLGDTIAQIVFQKIEVGRLQRTR